MSRKIKLALLTVLVAAMALLPQFIAYADDPKPPIPCVGAHC